jgi:hypothetical protein
MKKLRIERAPEVLDKEWVSFPGNELQAPRPKALCPACRQRLHRAAAGHSAGSGESAAADPVTAPLCFACYRASIDRDRALRAAGERNTTSAERFQYALPLEPVNRARLARLRTERLAAQARVAPYVDKRRHAQIAARHAIERIVIGLRDRQATAAERDRVLSNALHAAELQLPDAWLPFVIAR